MKDLQLLFCIISLFAGVSSISISCFVYNSNRKKTLKFFIGLNFCFFIIQNAITLGLYAKYVPEVNSFIPLMSKFSDIIGTSFSSLFGLFFINYLFGIVITNLKKNMYIFIFLLQIVGGTIYYFAYAHYILKFLLKASLLCVIAYELFIAFKNYKNIVNKDLKQAIRFFLFITIVFLPFIIFESYFSTFQFIKNFELFKLLAHPSYFLVINIFNLIFVLKYFNTPAFIANNKLTDYFKQKYDITEKQGEIIELIMEGATYKQIAEKLFISSKTVDNHIQNIYKKLNVNSKIQLLNLIRSNEI